MQIKNITQLAKDPKQLITWVFSIAGALGILRNIIEFLASAFAHSNILLGIFFFMGTTTIMFLIFLILWGIMAYLTVGLALGCLVIIFDVLLRIFPRLHRYEGHVKYVSENLYPKLWIIAVIFSAKDSIRDLFLFEITRRPKTFQDIYPSSVESGAALFFVIIGAAVTFGLCFIIYSRITKPAEEVASPNA